MTATLTESTVEDATLAWLEELGYAVLHGPDIAVGEPAAERSSDASQPSNPKLTPEQHERLDR